MQQTKQLVTEFHQRIGAPVASSPRLLPCDQGQARKSARLLRDLLTAIGEAKTSGDELNSRLRLAIEELAEWVEAHADSNLVAAADAWGDRLYVLMGDAVAAGLPVVSIFDEVHRSNMTKDSTHDASGKGVKQVDFRSPDLESVLDQEVKRTSSNSTT